ncbi:hypothetical protein TWF718_011228 [Orbilia javanica]|uniref:Apple domain-containing protein n=1 Tax=Orbilia javanica TaxID=47235 RepID=A0AAN8MMV0_9PEZI
MQTILELKLKRTTRTIPSTTSTKTVTIKPSTTKTVSATSYRTVVVTSQSITTSIVTETIPVVAEETTTEIETVFTYAETTSTTTITETAPEQEPCVVQAGDRLKKRRICKSSTLAASCSCHLTVTKRSGKATVTKTTTLPTSTKVITRTVSKPTTTVSFIGSTYTKTVTVTNIISTSTTTESSVTTSTTSTSVETAEATTRLPWVPCENPEIVTGISFPSEAGHTWDITPSESLSDCCRQCFEARNCAYYVRGDDGMCKIWFVTPDAWRFGCATETCDWGFSRQDLGGGSASFGPGRCIAYGSQR